MDFALKFIGAKIGWPSKLCLLRFQHLIFNLFTNLLDLFHPPKRSKILYRPKYSSGNYKTKFIRKKEVVAS